MNTRNSLLVSVIMLAMLGACSAPRGNRGMVVDREPWQMIRVPDAPPAHAAVSAVSSDNESADAVAEADMHQPDANEATTDEEAAGDGQGVPPKPNAGLSTTSQEPDAVRVHDYEPGSVYDVTTAPGFVTVVQLQPGEQLLNIAAGDTSRWLVETLDSGPSQASVTHTGPDLDQSSPAERRTTILLKPRRPDLTTNFVITTDRRTYLLRVTSVDDGHHDTVVEWTYPQSSSIVARHPSGHELREPEPRRHERHYVYVTKVPTGRTPEWAPVSVYHDGHRVYIHFPDDIDAMRRPPLFVLTSDGAVHLVNYHVEGTAYVVHERFRRAVLRLGSDQVLIERVRPPESNNWQLFLDAFGFAR